MDAPTGRLDGQQDADQAAADLPGVARRRTAPVRLTGRYAAFVLGTVLVAVGLGLGVRHLTTEGPTLVATAGLAVLAGGLAVMVWSVHRLLSRVPRRWWLLAVPLLLATAYIGLWTVGQGVAAASPPRPALGDSTPADVGLPYRDVTLRTVDDIPLAAWWVPSRNGAAVALLHGAGSTRTAVLSHAAVLAEAGYGVLLVDARGHGESGGRGMDFGWYGETDADAAVDFLVDQPGVSPERIGLVGLSMGGESAVGAAGVDPRVRAVVAEGATNRVAADKAYLAEAYGWRGQLQQGIDGLTYGAADLLTDAPVPAPLRDAVRATSADGTDTPVLLIAAGEVETEPLAAAYISDAAPAAVGTWTIAGSGHTGGLATAPAEWERRVRDFLDRSLTESR